MRKSTRFWSYTIGHDGVRCVHRGNAEEVVIDGIHFALSIVGTAVIAMHVNLSSTKVRVPLAGFVLIAPIGMQNRLDPLLCKGGETEVSYALPPPNDGIANAMAGGPMFFSDKIFNHDDCHSMDLFLEDFKGSAPPVTFSQDETYDHNLLPRMGVCIAKCKDTGNEELVCVAVDGRNLENVLGLTLRGTSDLLRL